MDIRITSGLGVVKTTIWVTIVVNAYRSNNSYLGLRLKAENITIERPEKSTGKYTMLKHVKRQRTSPTLVYELLKTSSTRYRTDGYAQWLDKWTVVKVIRRALYYHMFVDVGLPPQEWRTGGGTTTTAPQSTKQL
jgi:hypothetical protein